MGGAAAVAVGAAGGNGDDGADCGDCSAGADGDDDGGIVVADGDVAAAADVALQPH